METCANCRRTIGDMETPHVSRNQIVCAECYSRLAPEVIPYARKVEETAPGEGAEIDNAHSLTVLIIIGSIITMIFIWIAGE